MKKLLLLVLSCFTLSNVNAQSDYKRFMESEKKGSSYSTKEIKKAAKEYTELIYEEAKNGKVIIISSYNMVLIDIEIFCKDSFIYLITTELLFCWCVYLCFFNN